MKSLISILFSPKMALSLLFVFAAAMATATFIENDFGTQTARTVIYNAWWFELVMMLLGLNFINNIFRYKLYKRRKWPVLMFHLAFVIILIGAGITRYTGFEGIMRIREGAASNIMISDKNYLHVSVDKDAERIEIQKEAYFSPIKENKVSLEESIGGKSFEIELIDFISDAQEILIETDKDGEEYLSLVVSAGNGRKNLYLKEGGLKKVGGHEHLIGFNTDQNTDIAIFSKNDSLYISSPSRLDFFVMAEQKGGSQEPGEERILLFNTLYKSHDFSFVAVKHVPQGELKWVSGAKKPKDNDERIDDLVILELNSGGQIKEVPLIYRHGYLPEKKQLSLGGLNFEIAYGALEVKTDFELKLRDFQMEKYPGSTSPSSYASEVTILDEGQEIDYRIYMNNVLDYQGHRFFQASYDSDEKGTVLAVNKDRPGTIVTYIGYLFLGIGMFFTLFSKGSRFSYVRKKLIKLNSRQLLLFMLLISVNILNSKTLTSRKSEFIKTDIDSVLMLQTVQAKHANLFGKLMVQDLDGRIKPLNTLASEFLRKVSRKPYYKGNQLKMDANQVFLAMHMSPGSWYNLPLIKIDKKKGGELFSSLNPNEHGLVSFHNLLDDQENYLLEKAVLEANEKKPGERNEFDKEILLVDERFNLVFNVLSGNYLKIFPKKGDPSRTWYNPNHDFEDFETEDARFVKGILPIYFVSIQQAKLSGNWAAAEDKLAYIKKYQDVLAADIIPSKERIEAELWYNKLNLNFWLFQAYFTLGFILLVLALIRIFLRSTLISNAINFFIVVTLIAFLLQSFNLILRWYIAGHPPWSNGYEMIVFVSWGLMFFGLMFFRRSDFSLPLSSIFAGTLLFVSYLDWLSPEITNLMPVLKSYWLKIHVATIISSYAPLALSALLGVMAQLMIIFKTDKNEHLLNGKIKELSYINEMSMTLGLFILSIGTFLGGIWANESWGRYWAWDPKETWALISIIIYAIVLHMRLIPRLNNDLAINIASTFAFFSIIMTSFGVNYYLTGLHSYATGDPVPIPKFVYAVTGLLLLIAVFSSYKNVRGSKAAQ
ncbi:cytochrome c biogenesis protein [Lutimonas zeaxanthinifaciens]|uniref:cytochrome c biogenesis protein n=1 Tax=Lutimonas zeaxanthinifaciens TaxID=3060215 RepID=UPI00265CB9F5|nr:cytochrome c biogenesis protein CcsA [Lutimonas sp. YSD2104]WKK64620.1 cytochrome c biogenesis protein CcsA [Lutimonas sp. YSD2104]